MPTDDVKSELELIKQLGERMKTLVKLSAEHLKQLSDRSVLLARMYTEALSQFTRSIELAERIAERIQARSAQG